MIATAKDLRKTRPGHTVLDAPLYSAECELAVIGSMLAAPHTVIDEVCESLTRDDFFVPAHQTVFGALLDMHATRTAIDIVTLHQWLADRKLAEAVGSPGIIAEASNAFHSALNVGTYVKVVRDKSLLRRLQETAFGVLRSIAEDGESLPVGEVISRAGAAMSAVEMGALSGRRNGRWMRDSFRDWLRAEREKPEKPLAGISTGLDGLDELLGGWQPGKFYVLKALKKRGKSALAMQFAQRAAAKRWDMEQQREVSPGHRVAIFSLEMTEDELMQRTAVQNTAVRAGAFNRGRLKNWQIEQIEQQAEEIMALPIYTNDSSRLTMGEMGAVCRRLKRTEGLDMVVLDYLQLLRSLGDDKRADWEKVAEISRESKALSKELGVPFLALSQVNAQGEARNARDIEQDANGVLRLDTESGDTWKGTEPAPYKLEVEFNRAGATGVVPLTFLGECMTFVERKPEASPATHPARHSGQR